MTAVTTTPLTDSEERIARRVAQLLLAATAPGLYCTSGERATFDRGSSRCTRCGAEGWQHAGTPRVEGLEVAR